jgi:hypothetical protein
MRASSIFGKFVFVLMVSIAILSCSEDPVSPPPPDETLITDSSFFDWNIQVAYGSITEGYQFYVADTNKVFVAGNIFLTFFDNGTPRQLSYHSVNPDFWAKCVNGTSENDVYIGGTYDNGLERNAQMMHWNGSSFSIIDFPNDTSWNANNIEIASSNDIWISTDRSFIYRYYNQVIYTYRLDSGYIGGSIVIDIWGNIFASYSKYIYSAGSSYKWIFHLYRFNGNTFNIIQNDTLNSETSEVTSNLGKIDTDLIRTGRTGIYYYTANNWLKFVNTNNSVNALRSVAGSNRNNIVFLESEVNYGFFVYHFNGSKIYRQPANYPIPFIFRVQHKYKRYYMASSDFLDYATYLYTAKFKTKSKTQIKNQNENKTNNNYNTPRLE